MTLLNTYTLGIILFLWSTDKSISYKYEIEIEYEHKYKCKLLGTSWRWELQLMSYKYDFSRSADQFVWELTSVTRNLQYLPPPPTSPWPEQLGG